MKLRIVYAVRAVEESSQPWLADTCAGGTWTCASSNAVTFATMQLALEALEAAELADQWGGHSALTIVPLVEEQHEVPR